MKLLQTQVLVVLVLSVFVTGCAGYGNPASSELGAGYDEVVERQTAYPDRIVQDGSPVLDGAIAERVVKTYRADSANRQAVRNTINVNLGGGN